MAYFEFIYMEHIGKEGPIHKLKWLMKNKNSIHQNENSKYHGSLVWSFLLWGITFRCKILRDLAQRKHQNK